MHLTRRDFDDGTRIAMTDGTAFYHKFEAYGGLRFVLNRHHVNPITGQSQDIFVNSRHRSRLEPDGSVKDYNLYTGKAQRIAGSPFGGACHAAADSRGVDSGCDGVSCSFFIPTVPAGARNGASAVCPPPSPVSRATPATSDSDVASVRSRRCGTVSRAGL